MSRLSGSVTDRHALTMALASGNTSQGPASVGALFKASFSPRRTRSDEDTDRQTTGEGAGGVEGRELPRSVPAHGTGPGPPHSWREPQGAAPHIPGEGRPAAVREGSAMLGNAGVSKPMLPRRVSCFPRVMEPLPGPDTSSPSPAPQGRPEPTELSRPRRRALPPTVLSGAERRAGASPPPGCSQREAVLAGPLWLLRLSP